jgi:hypothetical protein
MTLYQQYQSGHRENAWERLNSLGAIAYEQPYFEDALAVAHETMTRARSNVEVLSDRLAGIGYDFLMPKTAGVTWMGPMGPEISTNDMLVHTPPHRDTDAFLEMLQNATGGFVPISVRAWYQIVGGVIFLGSHPRLSSYKEPTLVIDTQTVFADPLMVSPITSLVEELKLSQKAPSTLPLFADKYFKAGCSGGPPIEFDCSGVQADPVLHNEPHQLDFVNYLRRSFSWGGFPGWSEYPNRPDAEIRYLTQGLLSI